MAAKKKEDYDIMCKTVVIGDSGVGKTNLLTRLCDNQFKDTYTATIGVDFKIKSFCTHGKKYKMQIWDTAGQQRFKYITSAYYKGAVGIVLCYSIINRQSFCNIERWITQIQNNVSQKVSMILLGMKFDLNEQRKVSEQQGRDLAQKFGLKFLQVSSKTGYHVKDAFQLLVEQINSWYPAQAQNMSSVESVVKLKLEQQQTKKQNCRC